MKKIQNRKKKTLKKCLCVGLLAIVLLIVSYSSIGTKKMTSCIFCDIATGKLPSTVIEFDNKEIVIFKDIKPASTHHYLCVPKTHIESLNTLAKQDIVLIQQMEQALKDFFQLKGIDVDDALFGFHLPPFISVKHLHLHGISPRSNMSWINSFMFKPNTYWFKTVEEAVDYLRKKKS